MPNNLRKFYAHEMFKAASSKCKQDLKHSIVFCFIRVQWHCLSHLCFSMYCSFRL